MNRQIIEPHPDLAPLVKCYWTLESPKANTPQRNTIVPDGCMKLIFHYADAYKHYPDSGKPYILSRALVVGQLTKPFEVEPMGETGTFFVCFHPNGFLPFATSPIKELENKAVPIEKVLDETIGDIILNAPSNKERISLIEAFLFKRLADTKTHDNLVKSTVETILTANGQLSVDVLSKQNNTNRRQLTRKFSKDVGISPKQLSKTIRLQATLKMLLTENISSLTDLAYENEYYDQAHFIKEFKEFTGLTPKEFYGEHLKMSLIFDSKD